ncbi:MAG: hypothetical protein LBV74_08660 [Tannerella sp.]|jgi:zinc transport system substrate-binding protein|nr:hypothetical protein [Tannerella sp.]
MIRTFFKYILFFISVALLFFSCRGGKTSSGADDTSVVATSSWTAAYAQAAGAENIVILAPFDMEHPSEYELRPGDIPKLMDAEVIVYAGYEVMTERLKKGLDLPQDKLLLVDTDYSYEAIEKSVMNIAVKLGTEEVARKNLSGIRRAFDEGRDTVNGKQMSGRPVIVHRFQASVAKELGLVPVVLFGPAAPEASEIALASGTQASLIIDNLHNPVGLPFREVLPDTRYVQLLNFPGLKGTKTLTDVLRYNVSQIVQD